eukprot:TRINITY_DN7599_c0_g1_i1.p1 TRINITY_DN7599_c0_g1~~TRINITY_DN7599_c0_g1_i1.p1  ORF type:complete len:2485 (+),score=822.14 TRINITY_DN7599_c0_g1_i1:51-7457(+)
MPRIVCYGKEQPDTWKGRVGKTVAYKIGSVQSTRAARYRVVCLPHSDALASDDGDDPTVTLEVDGALHLKDADGQREMYDGTVKALAEQMRMRHSAVVLFHGLVGAGSTDALNVVVKGVLEGARKHIDTSARESRAVKDEPPPAGSLRISAAQAPPTDGAAHSPEAALKSPDSDMLGKSVTSDPDRDPFAGFGGSPQNSGVAEPPPPPTLPRRGSVGGPRRGSVQQQKAATARGASGRASGAGAGGMSPQPPAGVVPRTSPSSFRRSQGSPPASPGKSQLKSGAKSASTARVVPELDPLAGSARRGSKLLAGSLRSNSKRQSVSFQSMPEPQKAGSFADEKDEAASNLAAARGQRRLQSVQLNLQRKVSLTAFPHQSVNERPQSPGTMKRKLAGGRHGASNILLFNGPPDESDGPNGYVKVPEFPALKNHCMQSMIDCWVRTSVTDRRMGLFDIGDVGDHSSCRFAVHLNVDVYDDPKSCAIRVQIRDARHTLLEGHVVHEKLFDGRWHLVQFHVVNAKENLLDIRVDGTPCRMTLSSQSDHPYIFETWEQHGVIGGELSLPVSRDSTVLSEFEGALAEFRVWEMGRSPPLLVGHVRLDEEPVTDLVSHKAGEVVNMAWGPSEFPATAMKFNGFNFVNVGTLGGLGGSLRQCGVELWFRTIEGSRVMSLLKIRDPQKKHMMFGMTLNQAGDAHQRGALTLTVRDTLGTELVAVCHPTSSMKLCDGQWHSIQWQVIDSAGSIMTLLVDGTGRELQFFKKGEPKHFMPFTEFVPIGAFNNRGNVQELFDGMIRHVVITNSEGVVGCWCLDEGPGTRLAVDSGDPMWQTKPAGAYFHHGVFKTLYPSTNSIESKVRRASQSPSSSQLLPSQAVPHHSKNPTDWIACDIPEMEHFYGAMKRQEDKVEVAGQRDNVVKIACLAVEAAQKANSQLCLEVLRDVKADEAVELAPACYSLDDKSDLRDAVHLEELPESVWTRMESTDTLLDYFRTTTAALAEKGTKPGHHLWIVSIGGACTTFVDLAGVMHPANAKFDTRTGQWFSAVSSMGHLARQNACLNKGGLTVERAVQSIGSFPMLWLRNTPREQKVRDLEVWEESLVTRLMKSYGILGASWAHMYFIHATAPNGHLSKTELDYTETVLNRIETAQKDMASNSLTKLVNRVSQRMRGQAMRKEISKEMEFRRRSTLLIQRNPSAGLKSVRTAVVVCPWAPQDPRVPSETELYDNAAKVADVLAKQKFKVVLLASQNASAEMLATEANLTREVKRAVDDDAMLFVYVCGRSGGSTYFLPACPLIDNYELLQHEDFARTALLREHQAAVNKARASLEAALSGDSTASTATAKKRGSRSSMSRERVQAHSGGAGLQSKKAAQQSPNKSSQSIDDDEETNNMIRLAGERSKIQADETPRREFIAEVQTSEWKLLMKIITQTQKRYIEREQAPLHLAMDDTTLETTAANVLTVDKLKSLVMPFEPVVGVHRVLAVDAYDWKGESGFFAMHGSSGESIKGSYMPGARGVATNVLLKGLRGDALSAGGEVTEEVFGKDESISLSQLLAHTSRVLGKYAKQPQPCISPRLEQKREATLVGEATVCPKILRTPEVWKESKSIDQGPAALKKAFWMEVLKCRSLTSYAPDGTTGKDALTTFGEKLAKDVSGMTPGGVKVDSVFSYTQPFIDVVLNIQYEDLTPRQVDYFKGIVVQGVCGGISPEDYEVLAFPSALRLPADAPADAGQHSPRPPADSRKASGRRSVASTASRKSTASAGGAKPPTDGRKSVTSAAGNEGAAPPLPAASLLGGRTTVRIRKDMDHGDLVFEGDPRYVIPERLRLQEYKASRAFAETLWQNAFRGTLKESLKTYYVEVALCTYAKMKAPPTVAWALQKQWRKGRSLPLPGMPDHAVVAGGTFTNEEIAEYEKKITEENDRAKQSTLYNRKKQQRQSVVLKNQKRLERHHDELRKQVSAHWAQILEGKPMTHNALTTIFSPTDPEVIAKSCEVLLKKVDAPANAFGAPVAEAVLLKGGEQAVEGRHFITSLVDWGLLGILERILSNGTLDGEGQDEPAANTAILKLLTSVCIVCPRDFNASATLMKEVGLQLRRHHETPGVVRWALAILFIHARRAIVQGGGARGQRDSGGGISRAQKPMIMDLWQVSLHSLASVACRKDAMAIAQCVASLRYCLPLLAPSLDEEDLASAGLLAVHTVRFCGHRGAAAVNMDDPTLGLTTEAAVSRIAGDCVALLADICKLSDAAEQRIVYAAVDDAVSPYERTYERPDRIGPGVMVCSLCGARFTRQSAEADECPRSTTAAKKHAGPKADTDEQILAFVPEDQAVQRRPSSPLPAFRVAQDAVIAAAGAAATLKEVASYLSLLLDRDRPIQTFAQKEVLQDPDVVCEFVDACLELAEKDRTQLRPYVINVLWACFVDKTDSAESKCAAQLKARGKKLSDMFSITPDGKQQGLSPTCLPLVESVLDLPKDHVRMK